MKVSKKVQVLVLAFLVLLAASFSVFAAEDLNGKTLRLAVNAPFAPFEFTSAEGELQGLDIDIVKRLAEKLGFKMDISDMAFDGLVGALNSGRADFVISGISPTTERLKILDSTVSYFYPTISLTFLQGKEYPTVESLKGKKVGTIFGTTYETQAQAWEGIEEVIAFNAGADVVNALLSFRIDAAVLDGCHAAEFVKVHPDKLTLALLPIEIDIEDSFAILFPKGSPYRDPINAALTEMLKAGEVDALIEKWLGTEYLKNYQEGLKKAGFSY